MAHKKFIEFPERNGTGHRSKSHGNNKQRHSKGKESPDSWPGGLDDYEEEDDEDEDELKEIKGNSLLNGKHAAAPTQAAEVWTEDSFGQIYSDQEQVH